MKKITALFLAIIMLFAFTACKKAQEPQPTESANLQTSPTPSGIQEAPVDSIPTDTICTLIMDMTELDLAAGCFIEEVTADTAAYTIGYENFNGSFESAHSISPMMMTTPFVLVVFRLAEDADAEAFATDIKTNANLEKWVCVFADRAEAKVVGRTVLFYMSPESYVEPINQAFAEICSEGFVPEDHIVDPLKDISTMNDLYAKLYEMYNVEDYGFMDNANVLTVTADSGYGLNKLDSAQFTDSVIDDGYVEESDEDAEKAYVLAMFRIAEGVDAVEFIDAVLENLDTSALKGEDVELAVNYSDDIVIVYAGTGTYGIIATSLDMTLSMEFRMKSASVEE